MKRKIEFEKDEEKKDQLDVKEERRWTMLKMRTTFCLMSVALWFDFGLLVEWHHLFQHELGNLVSLKLAIQSEVNIVNNSWHTKHKTEITFTPFQIHSIRSVRLSGILMCPLLFPSSILHLFTVLLSIEVHDQKREHEKIRLKMTYLSLSIFSLFLANHWFMPRERQILSVVMNLK